MPDMPRPYDFTDPQADRRTGGSPTMPDMLSREELDAHRAYLALHRPDCRCTGSRLLVHIDALTGAVEALLRAWENNRYTEDVTEEVAAVLAILRGKK
jgi:hypothetical protein